MSIIIHLYLTFIKFKSLLSIIIIKSLFNEIIIIITLNVNNINFSKVIRYIKIMFYYCSGFRATSDFGRPGHG